MRIPIWLHHIPTLLTQIPLDEARQFLSQEESNSASNIKAERRLHEFIYGRYTLKHAIAAHLNLDAKRIELKKMQQGKLFLEGLPTHFNLTHSGDYLAYIISDAGPVGIDIEHPRRAIKDFMQIAQRYFAVQETEALQGLTNDAARLELFYKIWTLKEAALKTVGTGISAGLDRFDASAMSFDKRQSLQLEHSVHSLWFEHWHHPLEYQGVYLSAALEVKTLPIKRSSIENQATAEVYAKPEFYLRH